MQNFVGYKVKFNVTTGKLEKKWTECVADSRIDAARKMKVELKTVCLAR